jgi:tetratricopeptide (TPR) repeat protein
LQQAIKLSQASGDIAATVGFNINLADLTWLIDGPLKGLEVGRRATELADLHGHVFDARFAQQGALAMLFELGRWDEVLQLANELRIWSQEHQVSLMERYGDFEKTRVLFHRTVQGVLPLDEMLIRIFEMKELEIVAPHLSLAALMHAYAGERSATRELIDELNHKTLHATLYRARYLPDSVRALCAIGDFEYAERLLLQESDVAFARDRHAIVTARAIVAEAKGEMADALELFINAVRRWNQYGFVLEEGQSLLGAGRCLIALGRPAEASRKLQQAREISATSMPGA